MGLEEELRETERRMNLRKALGANLGGQGLELDGDPLAELMRAAGMDLEADEMDGFYDAMLADLDEEEEQS